MDQILFLQMDSPFSRSCPSHWAYSRSYSAWRRVVRRIISSRRPYSSSVWAFFCQSRSLRDPSYLVLVQNQFVFLEIPYIFLAYCSASLYFWLTLIPFYMTFIIQLPKLRIYYLNSFGLMPQFDFFSISCFKERPSQNIRYLIKRQLPKLIDISISESLQFINTAETKDKSLKQLKYTVLIAEGDVSKYLEKIIKALIKIWQQEIQDVEKTIKEIMKIIGYNVKSQFYLPLMFNLLQQEEIKNSPKNTIILLKLISYMLLASEDLQDHIPEIIKLIKTYEQLFMENDEGLSTVCEIAMTLISRLPSLEQENLVSTVFSVFLNVEATTTIPQAFRQSVKQSMKQLAKKAGYESVALLHSQEVGPVLSNIIQSKEYTNWNKTSKNRFKFDTIVRNCQGEAIKFLSDILVVMEYCISLDCDIEIRMDTLVLLEEMMAQQQVRQALKNYSVRVTEKILNVAIKWKVGKPQIKIRKAGVIDMIKMIELQVISESELLDVFQVVLPQIKSCISDDWAPELRFACCELIEKFLMATKQSIAGDQLKDIYVVLLERLDDSQDPIRKKITTSINIFFMCRYLPMTASVSSILEYMVNAIFIHYDDNNEQIRDAINVSLRYAARVDPNQVLKVAKSNLTRMKHKDQCEELIDYCAELVEDKKL